MSTSSQSEDNIIICNSLAQRNKFLSLLTPQPRYVAVSPYPTYNQKQLDMRRKIQVLKYEKNSTQASKITKSQKWSQLVNNNLRYNICNKNPYLPTPTSSCGVPGPLTFLTYDPTVPLYNYSSSKDVYANYTETINIPWSTSLNIKTQNALNGIETNLFTLAIQSAENPSYSFNFTVPIGIYVSGYSIEPISRSIYVTSALLNVYYYDGTINNSNNLSYSKIITNTDTPIFDNKINFRTTNTEPNYFEAIQYIGNISIPNIQLNSHYGYVYDFNLTFNIKDDTYNIPTNFSTNVSNDVSNFTYGVFLNTLKTTTTVNCEISPDVIISDYQSFSFNGI
jgi:hypothetical protein